MSLTDAPAAGRVGPPPGWYPDPTAARGTRFWDGTGWTDRTRSPKSVPPSVTAIAAAPPKAPAAAPAVPSAAPPARSRNWVAVLVILAIVVFAAAGALHVAGGTAGGSGDPNRFNGDNAQTLPDATQSTPRDGPCTGTNRPSATAIVALLHDRGQPVTAVDPPQPAGGAAGTTPPSTTASGQPADPLCSQASFDDPRGGRGTVYAFVSAAEAARAISAGLAGGAAAVRVGHIVVTLPSGLAPQQAAYQGALDTLPPMVKR